MSQRGERKWQFFGDLESKEGEILLKGQKSIAFFIFRMGWQNL